MSDEVVITGLGIVSPIGRGEDAFWESLCTGRSGAALVDALDTSQLPRKLACEVRDEIDAPPDTGRASRMAIDATRQAIASSGLPAAGQHRRLPDEPRCHVIVGTTMGETEFIESRLNEDEAQWLDDDHMGEIARGSPGSIAGHVRRVGQTRSARGPVGRVAIREASRNRFDSRPTAAVGPRVARLGSSGRGERSNRV